MDEPEGYCYKCSLDSDREQADSYNELHPKCQNCFNEDHAYERGMRDILHGTVR